MAAKKIGIRFAEAMVEGSGEPYWAEPEIANKSRVGTLMKSVKGLLCGGKLALTHLGRNLSGKGYEKYKIK